ncbi:MAG: LuxR family transcriptional regulator [Brevundimonas sp.]|nr:MAG: LuxR family transcriptional regulator [Brevundimonas sp.]
MEPVERLTARERQCLLLVHAHMNSKQIARKLGIQPATVDRHCENAARKLHVGSRVDAALLLAEIGIPTDSVSGSSPIVSTPSSDQSGGAKRGEHDQDRRPYSRHHLEPVEDRSRKPGGYAGEEDDGRTSGGSHTQTSAVPTAGELRQGDHLHRRGLAGRALPALGLGPEHLGRILAVLAIAAFVALVIASILGAERFAFVLQGLRYGR